PGTRARAPADHPAGPGVGSPLEFGPTAVPVATPGPGAPGQPGHHPGPSRPGRRADRALHLDHAPAERGPRPPLPRRGAGVDDPVAGPNAPRHSGDPSPPGP